MKKGEIQWYIMQRPKKYIKGKREIVNASTTFCEIHKVESTLGITSNCIEVFLFEVKNQYSGLPTRENFTIKDRENKVCDISLCYGDIISFRSAEF